MKRTGLVNLICSLVAVTVLCLAVVLVLVFTDVIRVVPEELVISSSSAVTTYDGKALVDDGWSLLEGELKEGHRLSVTVGGSQTNVGISENFIIATVYDSNGADVTGDYKLVYKPGALNVKPRSITLIAHSDLKLYDGEPLTKDEYHIETPLSLVAGHSLVVTVEGSITEVGTADNSITSVRVLDNHSLDVTRNYNIKTISGKLAVYPEESLLFETDDASAKYTGNALTDSDWRLVSGQVKPTDRLVVEVVGSQTDVGTSENGVEVKIYNNAGVEVTNEYTVVCRAGLLTVIPQELTIKSHSAQKVYDGTPLTEQGITVSPTYAYTDKIQIFVNTAGTQTEVGSSPNTIGGASVISKIDGRDITHNYDITYEFGTLTVTENDQALVELEFESGDKTKVYDGAPLTSEKWELVKGELKEGHTPVIKFSGEITDVGKADNEFKVTVFDNEKNDVTEEYMISCIPGELEVTPAEVTVRSYSDSKAYDGTALTCDKFSIAPSAYGDRFDFRVELPASQTEIGTTPNTISSVSVFDSEENDVTRNFLIKKDVGELSVVAEEPKPVLVYSSGSDSKTYDGTPLANGEGSRISGELKEGHTEVIQLNATLTKVGMTENTIVVKIFDGEVDVTDQYIINYEPGTLEVTPRAIKITTASDKKTYDGTALTAPDVTVEPSDGIVEGDKLSCTLSGTITFPGEVYNTLASWTVTNSEGEDVSYCYEVEVKNGTLRVDERVITITTASDEKFYNGKPLTNSGYETEPADALVNGHSIEMTVTGTITNPGSAANTVDIESVKIVDSMGNDRTGCYDINIVLGTLTVHDGESSDGTSLGLPEDYDYDELKNVIVLVINSDTTGKLYFKGKSYGDFTGNGFVGAGSYDELLFDELSAYYLNAYAIDGTGADRAYIKIVSNFGQYLLPYYSLDIGADKQESDVFFVGNADDAYYVYYLPEDAKDYELTGELLEFEAEYEKHVRENYLSIDDETLAFMQGIIREQRFSVTDPLIISKVASYIQGAADYNLKYDRGLDTADNVAIAFLRDYGEGVCQHYATAGTMLFRALGIPARYTTGYVGYAIEGQDVEVTAAEAHAWVEIYKSGFGWVRVEVTGGAGGFPDRKPITIIAGDGEKEYDGTPLYAEDFEVKNLPDGVRLEVELSGSITEPGSTESAVLSYRILDSSGKDVTSGYDVSTKNGTLTVKPANVTLVSGSATKVYDGTPLTNNSFELISEVVINPNHVFLPEITGTITEFGDAVNTIESISVVDEYGNDVSSYYIIEPIEGSLKITKKKITVSAVSDQKTYDGTPLENGNVTVDWGKGGAVLTDTVSGVVDGSLLFPDKIVNALVSVSVTNADGKDVTFCYEIKMEDGTLEVLPIHITVKSATDTKFFDGTPLENHGFEVIDEASVVEGHTVVPVITGSYIEVGRWKNTIEDIAVTDSDGNDVTAGYDITPEEGTLLILSGDIVVVADDGFKYYDGTPLTVSTYKIYSENIDISNLVFDVVITGSITEPDSVPNVVESVTVYLNGEDVTAMYTVDKQNGTLTVEKKTIKVISQSNSKYYDGTPLTQPEYTIESNFDLSGFTVLPEILGSQTEPGKTENSIGKITVLNEHGEDVSGSFEFLREEGWLEVEMIEIVITTEGARRTYDGTPLTKPDYTVDYYGELPEGHFLTVKITGSQTEPGESENTAVVTVTDKAGNLFNDYYLIDVNEGMLSVVEIELTITANNDVKVYDGTPLENKGYVINPEKALLDGHTLSVTVVGSITDPGVEKNVIASYLISDKDGKNVTEYYNVRTVDGKLVVIVDGITVIANSDRKTYDGTPLKSGGYTVLPEGALPEGFYVIATVEGEITRPGTEINRVVSAVLYTPEGEPVYDVEIQTVDGELTVDPIKLTLVANSDKKTYDGRPLTNSGVKMSPTDALLRGHSIAVTVEGSYTEPGEWENRITDYIITDTLTGEDMTDCYDITRESGTLTIYKIAITVKAKSDEKLYDGTPLTYPYYEIKGGNLASGHSIHVVVEGSVTEPKTVDNVITSVVITNASGEDVTERYYEIITENGTLTVYKPIIVFTSQNKTKEYDGKPLTCNEFYIIEGETLAGHELEVVIVGSVTEIGWDYNTVESYRVIDTITGEDVTDYYEITPNEGILEVLEEMVYFTVTLNSGKGSSTTDTVYLKLESFGDYDPMTNTWSRAEVYSLLLDGDKSAYYLPGYAMDDSGIGTYQLTIISHAGLFALPYYTFYDSTYGYQTSDTYMSGDTYGEYTATYFKYGDNYFANIELPEGDYTNYETKYRSFVYGNYLEVDDETEQYLKQIIAEKGFNKAQANVINNVAKYIKAHAKYNDETEIDNAENPVIEFFEKKEGMYRHYAAAATLLFRTLGIPARYTEGFMAEAIKEGKATDVTSSMAHAWVEVYIDGKGWTRVEVRGNADGGVTFPVKMTITPSATYVIYDGTVHNPNQTVSGFSLSENGYIYEVVVEGSSAELGFTTTRVTQLIIYNSFGEMVYNKETGLGEDKFIMTYKTGILQNYISSLSFKSDSFTKTYDGIEYVLSGEECHLVSGALADGYTYVITPTTRMTDVGQAQNVFEVSIYKDGVLCNDHYRISRSYGTLKINTRNITIKAKDASKVYDGTELTCNEIEYLESELANGDYIAEYTVEGSQTKLGKSSNVVKRVVIRNKDGKDVTSNYSTKYEAGVLNVKLK